MKPALILFDIDGTLLLSGRAGLRAMTRAFEHTFGITEGFKGESFGGRTDSYLVSKALTQAGLPDTRGATIIAFATPTCRCWPRRFSIPGQGHKGLMPGARELLEALDAHDHLHLALLTGNYREAAEIKLQHFEIWDFFEWGAFSDDAADRNALVPIARAAGGNLRHSSRSDRARDRDRRHAARHRMRARRGRAIDRGGDRRLFDGAAESSRRGRSVAGFVGYRSASSRCLI